jgi:hypothetical protein
MAAMLSWMYKDDFAFISHSPPFLRCKHTEPGEKPEDGGYVVLGVYKDDLAFSTNSLPFLRCKHTEPGEEPEDGGDVVLDVQRRSCSYF